MTVDYRPHASAREGAGNRFRAGRSVVVTQQGVLYARVAQIRVAAWLAILAMAGLFYRHLYAGAWKIALGGVALSLLWLAWPPALRADPYAAVGGDSEARAAREGAVARPLRTGRQRSLPAVGADVLLSTALLLVSGGFGGPFAPFAFLVVAEVLALCDVSWGLAAPAFFFCLSAFRINTVYGLFGAAILAATLWNAWRLHDVAPASETPTGAPEASAALSSPEVLGDLVQALETRRAAGPPLEAASRPAAPRPEEQEPEWRRLRAVEQLFAIEAADSEATSAYAAMLQIVMGFMEAEGGALWLQDRDALIVQAAEESVAVRLSAHPIAGSAGMTSEALQQLCTEQLRRAARTLPETEAGAAAEAESNTGPSGETGAVETVPAEALAAGSGAVSPVAVVLIHAAGKDGVLGALLGALGVCSPRARGRFSTEDDTRLQELAVPLAAALGGVARRHALQQRVRETTLLYELNKLLQDAPDVEDVYRIAVEQAQRAILYENCTLFRLNPEEGQLEARTTQGRCLHLIERLVFDDGEGLSGWLARREKTVLIPDLAQESGLRGAEALVPYARSVIAAPLEAQDSLLGVLTATHSEPDAFTVDDLRLLSLLAEQVALSIERTEIFQTLETLALTDELTQVYNHRYFQIRLEEELRRGQRYQVNVAVIMVDVDDFKEVNDHYGHITGDRILHDIAMLLRRSVRATEIVARYGGDEFALILPQTEYDAAQIAAERLRDTVATHEFTTAEGEPIPITISVGLAASPMHGRTRAALIEQADRALYGAKHGGRNRVVAEPGTPTAAIPAEPEEAQETHAEDAASSAPTS